MATLLTTRDREFISAMLDKRLQEYSDLWDKFSKLRGNRNPDGVLFKEITEAQEEYEASLLVKDLLLEEDITRKRFHEMVSIAVHSKLEAGQIKAGIFLNSLHFALEN